MGRKPYSKQQLTHPDNAIAPQAAPGAVIGRNAVRELLKSGKSIDKIFVLRGEREGSITQLVAQALDRGIPVVPTERGKLAALSGNAVHQGIVALAAEKEYVSIDTLFEIAAERGEQPFFVIADNIADPHNLGALLRSCEAQGVHGLIIPKRCSCGMTPTVSKTSAGALTHIAVARVGSIAQLIDELKRRDVWIFTAEAGGTDVFSTDFDCPCALIFGSEGNGVSRLIREKSDFIVSVPMYGHVNSLNVSAAAAVIISTARHTRAVAAAKRLQ